MKYIPDVFCSVIIVEKSLKRIKLNRFAILISFIRLSGVIILSTWVIFADISPVYAKGGYQTFTIWI